MSDDGRLKKEVVSGSITLDATQCGKLLIAIGDEGRRIEVPDTETLGADFTCRIYNADTGEIICISGNGLIGANGPVSEVILHPFKTCQIDNVDADTYKVIVEA